MTAKSDDLLARLHDLRRHHDKAAKKRDEWAEKAEHFHSKIKSYEEVLADQGIGVESAAPAAAAAGSLAEAVLEAARSLDGEEITVDRIRERLPDSYRGKATSTISRALIRLAPDDYTGPLYIVKKGSGRRPSTYVWIAGEETDEGSANVTPFRSEKM